MRVDAPRCTLLATAPTLPASAALPAVSTPPAGGGGFSLTVASSAAAAISSAAAAAGPVSIQAPSEVKVRGAVCPRL